MFGGWGADGHTKLARNEQYMCVICVCVACTSGWEAHVCAYLGRGGGKREDESSVCYLFTSHVSISATRGKFGVLKFSIEISLG